MGVESRSFLQSCHKNNLLNVDDRQLRRCGPNKKPLCLAQGESEWIHYGRDSSKSADFRLTEYRCIIVEVIQYGAAGAEASSRTKSFVCHTTPHSGSTSREVSYSVRGYDTRKVRKCKSLFSNFAAIYSRGEKAVEKNPFSKALFVGIPSGVGIK